MLNHMRYRIVIVTLVAGIACISVGPMPAPLGQGQDHKRPGDRESLRVFGRGGAARALGAQKPLIGSGAEVNSNPFPKRSKMEWTFYSCEVTNL